MFGVILLAVCVGAPIAEMFDHWDHTAQDGNDTESNLIVVGVCVGIGLVAAATMLRRIRPSTIRCTLLQPFRSLTFVSGYSLATPTPTTSPPIAFRV
jgi:hypothetical protein